MVFFQLFILFLPKFQQILPFVTEFRNAVRYDTGRLPTVIEFRARYIGLCWNEILS